MSERSACFEHVYVRVYALGEGGRGGGFAIALQLSVAELATAILIQPLEDEVDRLKQVCSAVQVKVSTQFSISLLIFTQLLTCSTPVLSQHFHEGV